MLLSSTLSNKCSELDNSTISTYRNYATSDFNKLSMLASEYRNQYHFCSLQASNRQAVRRPRTRRGLSLHDLLLYHLLHPLCRVKELQHLCWWCRLICHRTVRRHRPQRSAEWWFWHSSFPTTNSGMLNTFSDRIGFCSNLVRDGHNLMQRTHTTDTSPVDFVKEAKWIIRSIEPYIHRTIPVQYLSTNLTQRAHDHERPILMTVAIDQDGAGQLLRQSRNNSVWEIGLLVGIDRSKVSSYRKQARLTTSTTLINVDGTDGTS